MVVVCTGKPSSEIIRSKKERMVIKQQGINDADSKENISQNSCPVSSDLGILRILNLKSMDLGEKRSAGEIFKERIEEIDNELKRFDPAINMAAKNIANTGKENLLASLSLTDDQPVDTQNSHA